MRGMVWLLVTAALLCVVLALSGCGGGDPGGGTVQTAAKSGGGLPPPEAADTGSIYFRDYYAGICRVDWSGGTYTVASLTSPTAVTGGLDVAASSGRRYLVYLTSVSPVYHCFSIWENYESGGAAYDLVPSMESFLSSAVVSPDGQSLAWAEHPPLGTAGHSSIFVAPLVFTAGLPSGVNANARIHVCDGLNPRWSPDGAQLAVSPSEGVVSVVMVAQDQTPVRVIPATRLVVDFNWAPGDRIVFTEKILSKSGSTSRYDISTVSPASPYGITPVTSKANASTSWNDFAAYNPGGRQIAYRARSTMSGDSRIYRTMADGSSSSVAITGALSGRSPWYLRWSN